MMSESITIDLRSLDAAVKKVFLPQETMNKILSLTVSKTARWASTRFKGQLAKKTKVTGKVIQGRMRLTIHKEGTGEAHLWTGFNPLNLSRFNPTATPSGVNTDVKNVEGAFMVSSLGKSVFKRRGTGRLPIDKQFLSIKEEGMVVFNAMVAEVEKALARNFEKAYLSVLTK